MKDPVQKTIGYRLTHTARLQKALSARLLAALGLFPGQESVLKLLCEADGRTMGDLASALRVRPPTASKTIARLTTQGLVERRATDGDGRLVRVFLTDAGRERGASIDNVWDQLEAEMVLGLDSKEKKRLRKLLRKVEKNLALRLGADGGLDDEAEPGDEDEDA
ncbi:MULTISPECIES: MarR family winged helix-turn-helix transcriptional regulator [Xanthobacter]|uniref:DNA-binding MarR family transcriptional regulator n=1 Tax=Xanthobacter flavus TaxID=281 RepID=A0A9W6CEJ0_XANFL|nr:MULTISPECIES: MarR family transcriptional regulator [Xanthobacter]MBN8918595.1 MarR family transcriptional regulator [Hyphomicrobiales bacterium]MDR6332589.1 DNA-binding MarR family transcriptional regulator [Xanthobacter flavus]NMN57980.1 DNA-binding MarR family transcriptional regulator [Xanthobacter sp. SG618]UDQ90802.1 MarR family transcriptional regulator [Xanthobacter autotrophicus]UJX47446.1 MarR family transcriptional regulator [Xanthobacter sp. YC-JY1]